MKVQIKLMGMLQGKVPAAEHLELTNNATIAEALDVLGIPRQSVQVFTVNGSLIRDQNYVLQDGNELTILPPVGGG